MSNLYSLRLVGIKKKPDLDSFLISFFVEFFQAIEPLLEEWHFLSVTETAY